VSFQQRHSLRVFLAEAQSHLFELIVPPAGAFVCPFDLSTLVLASATKGDPELPPLHPSTTKGLVIRA
jgi:hypothetical protein